MIRTSRIQLHTLCTSCRRNFALNRSNWIQAQSPRLGARTAVHATSTRARRAPPPPSASVHTPTFFNPGRPPTEGKPVSSAAIRDLFLHFKSPDGSRPPPTSIFTDNNPENELSITGFADLHLALEKADLNTAWAEFKQNVTPERIEHEYSWNLQFLRSSHILSRLFRDILNANVLGTASEQNLPSVSELVQTYESLSISNPSHYTLLLIQLLKAGDMTTLGAMLEPACRLSNPIQRTLEDNEGMTYNPFGNAGRGSPGGTLEVPIDVLQEDQLELWVVIYAVYNYLRSQEILPSFPYWATLSAAIPNAPIPPESAIRHVLAGHGFSEKFLSSILESVSTIEYAASITNLRALRSRISTIVESRDLRQLTFLYNEGRSTISHLLLGRHYDCFISAFMALRQPTIATSVWNDMVLSGIEPTQYSWNALLTGCTKAQDMSSLFAVWQKMIDTGVEPDTFCWTTRVHALFSMNRVREGLACLQEMAAHGTPPNINTINAAIDGLMRYKHLPEAQAVLKIAMEKYKIKPDLVTYNTILNTLMKQGHIEEANRILSSMETQGIRPDVVTWTIVLNGIYKHAMIAPEGTTTPIGTASRTTNPGALDPGALGPVAMCEQLITEMKNSGIDPNANTYTVLMDGLLSSSNLPAAKAVWTVMTSRNIRPTAASYTIFIRYYFKTGMLREVQNAWRDMQERNIPPDNVMFDETIKGFAKFSAQTDAEGREMTPKQARELEKWATGQMLYWLQQATELSKPSSRPGTITTSSATSVTPTPSDDIVHDPTDHLPKTSTYKIQYLTYKEVLGRLLREGELELAELVVQEVGRRVQRDGLGTIGYAMHYLKDVLKILVGRGVRIPEVLADQGGLGREVRGG